MIDLNYSFFNEVFNEIWGDSNFSVLTTSLKGITITFLIVRYAYILFKQRAKKNGLDSGEPEAPISMWLLGKYFAIALAIASYDKVLQGADGLLGYFVHTVTSLEVKNVTIQLTNADKEAQEFLATATWYESLKMTALEVYDALTSPTLWILSIVKVFVWLIDQLVYAIFICERFFVLLILKFTGPVVLALSLVPKFGSILGKWFSLYARWYLLIIPYFFVNLVVNGFFAAYEHMFDQFDKDSTFIPYESIGELIQVPLLLLIVILKFKLYSTAKSTYNELINIDIRDND